MEKNIREVLQIHTIRLSTAVWIGCLVLFGLATDDGVLMATYVRRALQNMQPSSVEDVRHCIIHASEKRIKPCLMTTFTTLFALLCILTSTGRGSDLMIPMAVPSFGGLLFALITLFVVPVLPILERRMENSK